MKLLNLSVLLVALCANVIAQEAAPGSSRDLSHLAAREVQAVDAPLDARALQTGPELEARSRRSQRRRKAVRKSRSRRKAASKKSKKKSKKGKKPSKGSSGGSSSGGVPSALKALQGLAGAKKCKYQLDTRKSGYIDAGNSPNAHYCGDSKSNPDIIWWVANVDVDCDGAPMTGKCARDPTHSSQTAWMYKGQYIDATKVPYIVINQDKNFDPTHYGVEGMAVGGIICNGHVFYGIIGDTNPSAQMGEASIALATKCIPQATANFANNNAAVYFVLTGSDAVDKFGGRNPSATAAQVKKLLSGVSVS